MKKRSTKRLTIEEIESRIKCRLTEQKLDHIKFIRVTDFKGSNSQVMLFCEKHGVTWNIDYHTIMVRNMFGCRRCGAEHRANSVRLSKESFIERASKIHAGRYDYSEIHDFNNMNEKVKIICPKHGPFYQTPSSHILGEHAGCKKCFDERDSLRKFEEGRERFFNEASAKYGNRYDYSKVDYKGCNIKVCIICPKHGEVWQTPYQHIKSDCGCPLCTKELRIEKSKLGETKQLLRIEKRLADLNSRGFNISFIEFVLLEGQMSLTNCSKVRLHCNIHNITWESNISNFVFSNGVFCPECSKDIQRSNGEKNCYLEVIKYRKIEDVISNKRLHILPTDDVKYSNISMTLLPDIYIKEPDDRGDIIIEYDGRQHYEYEPYLQGDKFNFIKQVRRDQFLQIYCKENNIRLLRIPWKDEKRIPEIIRSFLVEGIDITTKVYPKIPPVVII